MAGFDFSIRTKLTIWAALGILLVAGMLAEQQIGDRSAARERDAANSKQLAAVEALRAANDLARMRLEMREMRLAIAPSDVDHALQRLHDAAASAKQHIESAVGLSDDPVDKAGLEKLAALSGEYVGVSEEFAAAAKDYGDTVQKVQRAVELGNEMNDQLERSTGAAADRDAKANAERRASAASTSASVCSHPAGRRRRLRRADDREADSPHRRSAARVARGNKDVEVPYTARADEVGDNARAAQAFKEKLILIEQLEIAEKETAQRTAAQRRSDINEVARTFESTVAGVVRSVSSSSTELEAAAEALSAMAAATRDLSGKVLSANLAEVNNSAAGITSASEQILSSAKSLGQDSSRLSAEMERLLTAVTAA